MLSIDAPYLFVSMAIVGVILTGISKSGFAGGAGVVAVPMLALVMPVEQAVTLMLPLLLLMDIRAIRLYRLHLNRALLRRLMPPALVGIALGGWLLGRLPEQGLQLLLAVLSIVFACWQPLLKRLRHIKGFASGWGLLSGLSSTLIHAGGPPINAYLMTLELSKLRWLATTSMMFGLMNVVKIIPYTLADAWRIELFWLSLLLAPVAWLGIGLGYRIQARISEVHFLLLCRILLLGSGCLLALKAIM